MPGAGALAVEEQRAGDKSSSGSELVLDEAWWKRTVIRMVGDFETCIPRLRKGRGSMLHVSSFDLTSLRW